MGGFGRIWEDFREFPRIFEDFSQPASPQLTKIIAHLRERHTVYPGEKTWFACPPPYFGRPGHAPLFFFRGHFLVSPRNTLLGRVIVLVVGTARCLPQWRAKKAPPPHPAFYRVVLEALVFGTDSYGARRQHGTTEIRRTQNPDEPQQIKERFAGGIRESCTARRWQQQPGTHKAGCCVLCNGASTCFAVRRKRITMTSKTKR